MAEKFFTEDVTEEQEIMLDPLLSLSKSNLKKLNVEIPSTQNEARFLIDNYYQIQSMRIAAEGQIRSIVQGSDNDSSDKSKNQNKITSLLLLYDQYKTMENNAKKMLDAYTENNPLAKWASQVTGIGPVLAASLPAYLSIKKEPDGSTKMHAGSFWNYCGLNDNNKPWLGREKSTAIVEEAIAEHGGLNDETMLAICGKSGWKMDHFLNFKPKKNDKTEPGCFKINKKTGEKVWDKNAVISACSVIPYNKELKVVCYKIGTSFHKVCNNPKSLYGRLFKERLQYELEKNEAGDYADQAAAILNSKKFKSKETEEVYKSGKLPISHIYSRCQRYVTKLFISHVFECAYYLEYGEMPPVPYALQFCGHTDYIPAEVPYDPALWEN